MSSVASSDIIDLGYLLAPLTRPQLELIIIDLLHSSPSTLLPLILNKAQSKVDTLEILSSLTTTLESAYSVEEIINEVEPIIERSNDYLHANHINNAIAILETVTGPVVEYVKRNGTGEEEGRRKGEEGGEEEKTMSHLFTQLENAWQSVFEEATIKVEGGGEEEEGKEEEENEEGEIKNVPAPPHNYLINDQLIDYQKKLMKYKQDLTPSLGPVFSDTLRTLKKKIRKEAGGENSNQNENNKPANKKSKK